MAKIRHYRNGLLVDAPRNWKDTEFEFVWDDKKVEANITVGNLEFIGKEAIELRKRILNGLTGGVGIFEGEPYDIEIGDEGNPTFTFKGYLDFVDQTTFIGPNVVRAALKKKKGSDWLNDVADGYTFRYLYDIGHITIADFKKIPYVINYIPDEMQLIMLIISTFMLTKELVSLTQETATQIGELVDGVTPNVGAAVTMDIGDVIWLVLTTVARIAYGIAIVVALKNLIEDIIEQIYPPIRYHLAMSYQTLMQKAVSYLGYTLQSSLLNDYRDWYLIPSKNFRGGEGDNNELGCPSLTDPTDKIGDLIRVFKKMFNADYLIKGNTFIFERENFFQNQSNLVLKEVWDDQNLQFDVISPNAQEIVSNYMIDWAYDLQDQNTLDNREGMIFQVTTEPIIEMDSNLRNLKNLVEIDIPFTMGTRKEKLTKLEEFIKKLCKLADKVTNTFGNGTSLESKVSDRVGVLLLSSHFLSLPKTVIMQGDKLATEQRAKLSAKNIYFDCHTSKSFVEINGVHNQWLDKKNIKMPFSKEDLSSILDNPFCKNVENKDVKIKRLKYKPYNNTAEIDFGVNEKYTNNLKHKYSE